MTKPTVYLETSVIGYATSSFSRDLVVAARQQITRDWFADAAHRYELLVSEIVIDEVLAGDENEARERAAFIEGIQILGVTDDAVDLAAQLTEQGAVPSKAADDAVHIATAAVHGVKYLLTWNFRHIANVVTRQRIETVCMDAGFGPPLICTPEELKDDTEY